ncbi:hypothetical protein U1Q18_014808, partial [Sarracenia purpurea var. burkii]
FSLSEAESGYGVSLTISGFFDHRPKPIRTSVSVNDDKFYNQKPKIENGFMKTKLKAMKIYGDLNSIFTLRSAKKAKISSPTKLKSTYTSICSSSSPFSRSCLSKTPESINLEIPICGFVYCVGRFGFVESLSDQPNTRPRPD